jgi:hypothetical protein
MAAAPRSSRHMFAAAPELSTVDSLTFPSRPSVTPTRRERGFRSRAPLLARRPEGSVPSVVFDHARINGTYLKWYMLCSSSCGLRDSLRTLVDR